MSSQRPNRPTPFGKPPNRPLGPPPAAGSTSEGLAVSEALRRVVELFGDRGAEGSLRARCARGLRAEAYLLDVDRLEARAAARLASRLVGAPGTSPTEADLAEETRRAMEDLLAEDRKALAPESGSWPGGIHGASEAPWNGHHDFLRAVFALDAATAAAAGARFNDLDARIRKAFMALLIEGRSIEECVAAGLGSAPELGSRARSGLRALFLLDGEPGENEGPEAADP